jgi:hypothetical protein
MDEKREWTRRWVPENEGKTLLGGLNLEACKISTRCAAAMLNGGSVDPGHPINCARAVTNPSSLLKSKGE